MNQSLYIPGAVLLGLGVLLLIVWLIYFFMRKNKMVKYALFIGAFVLIIPGAVLLGVGLSESEDVNNNITIQRLNVDMNSNTSVMFFVPEGSVITLLDVCKVANRSNYSNLFTFPVVGQETVVLNQDDIALFTAAAPQLDTSQITKQRLSVQVHYGSGVDDWSWSDIDTFYTNSVPLLRFAKFHTTDLIVEQIKVACTGNNTMISYVKA